MAWAGSHPTTRSIVVNPDGTGRHRLTNVGGNGIFRPEWSANGNRLLAWEQQEFGGSGTTVALNADGTGRTPVSTEAIKASWSPDGSKIVYVALVNGIEQVITAAANGTGRAQVASIPTFKWIARWSPTDDRIAFGSSHLLLLADPDNSYGGISVIDADAAPTANAAAANRGRSSTSTATWTSSTGPRTVRRSRSSPSRAAWCRRTLHSIATAASAARVRSIHQNIYVVTVATGAVAAITLDRSEWTSVAWSPDGARLAATVNKGSGRQPCRGDDARRRWRSHDGDRARFQ